MQSPKSAPSLYVDLVLRSTTRTARDDLAQEIFLWRGPDVPHHHAATLRPILVLDGVGTVRVFRDDLTCVVLCTMSSSRDLVPDFVLGQDMFHWDAIFLAVGQDAGERLGTNGEMGK